MKLLEVNGISVRYGELTILDNVSFSLSSGQWMMLVGPNGAGKSTLVNAISQGVPYSGRVNYLGEDIRRLKPHELARQMGVLSQNHSVGYSYTVGEVVRLGRYCHAPGIFSKKSCDHEGAVRAALEMTGMTPFANQSVLTLSGGELQRTFLAQLFAQDPRILILDEPTNHLDPVYQKQTFELIQQWLKTHDGAVISVVHDLSLAKAYGTHALLLDGGRTAACGSVEQVFTPEHLNGAYRMDIGQWMRRMLEQWS